MTRYVCAECGADAVTLSPDGNTLPRDAEVVVPEVTHCSNTACAKSDPHLARSTDFRRVDEE
ncbi:hypothetical protein [Leucobacter sp.]